MADYTTDDGSGQEPESTRPSNLGETTGEPDDGLDLEFGSPQISDPLILYHCCPWFLLDRLDVNTAIDLFPALKSRSEKDRIQAVEMARSMVEDLVRGRAATHEGPTGSGKSFGSRLAVAILYRHGFKVLIATPSLQLADEAVADLKELVPEAFEAGAVAEIFGGNASSRDEEAGSDTDGGAYPVYDHTRIIVCTHAQLGRRGWSQFLRPLLRVLSRPKKKEGFQPWHIIIDEYSDFIGGCRMNIDLGHRVTKRKAPDGSSSWLILLTKCPKKAGSGSCGNCYLRTYGGSPDFDQFNIRILRRPGEIKKDREGVPANTPIDPLGVHLGDEDLAVTPPVPVGRGTWAAKVLSYQGEELEEGGWRTREIRYFERNRDEEHAHPAESNQEVLSEMLRFAWRAVVTSEHPVNTDGLQVKADDLRRMIETEVKEWDKGVSFPSQPCEAPCLRFTDLAPLESIKKYRDAYRIGVIFLGATRLADDREILEEVFPNINENHTELRPDASSNWLSYSSTDGAGFILWLGVMAGWSHNSSRNWASFLTSVRPKEKLRSSTDACTDAITRVTWLKRMTRRCLSMRMCVPKNP
jgi:hypothetical protein